MRNYGNFLGRIAWKFSEGLLLRSRVSTSLKMLKRIRYPFSDSSLFLICNSLTLFSFSNDGKYSLRYLSVIWRAERSIDWRLVLNGMPSSRTNSFPSCSFFNVSYEALAFLG